MESFGKARPHAPIFVRRFLTWTQEMSAEALHTEFGFKSLIRRILNALSALPFIFWSGDSLVLSTRLQARADRGESVREAARWFQRRNVIDLPATEFIRFQTDLEFFYEDRSATTLAFTCINERGVVAEREVLFPISGDIPRYVGCAPSLKVSGASFAVDSSIIVKDGTATWPLLQAQTAPFLNSHGAGSDMRALYRDGMARALFPNIEYSGEDVPYVLFGARSWEWGHFMIDFLARVAAASPPPGSTLLVDSRLNSSHTWWLEALIPEVTILKYDLGNSISVDEAIYLLPRTLCPPTWRASIGKPKTFWNLLPKDARTIRRNAVNDLHSASACDSRIWLKRRGRLRTVTNIQALERVLADLNFVSIYPEDLSPDALAPILQNARWVVGVAGSAFQNLLIGNGDARVGVITVERDLPFTLVDELKGLGHDVCVILGESKHYRQRGAPPGHDDIHMSDSTLRALVEVVEDSA